MATLIHKAETKALDPQSEQDFEDHHANAANKVLGTPELLAQILYNLDTPELMVCMLVNKSMHNAITKTSKLRARIESLHIQSGRRFDMPGFSYCRTKVSCQPQKRVVEFDHIDMAFEIDGASSCKFYILGSRWREMLIYPHRTCTFDVYPRGGRRTEMRAEVSSLGELWRELQRTWFPVGRSRLAPTHRSDAFPKMCIRVVAYDP